MSFYRAEVSTQRQRLHRPGRTSSGAALRHSGPLPTWGPRMSTHEREGCALSVRSGPGVCTREGPPLSLGSRLPRELGPGQGHRHLAPRRRKRHAGLQPGAEERRGREVGVRARAQNTHPPKRGSHHPHLCPGSPTAWTVPPAALPAPAKCSHNSWNRMELKRGSDSHTLSGVGLQGPDLGHLSAQTRWVPRGTWGFHCGRNSPPGE